MLGLCERFGCLPSQLLDEDAELARMVLLESLGRPETREGGSGGERG